MKKNIYYILSFIFVFCIFAEGVFGAVSSDPNAGLTPGNATPLTGTDVNLNSAPSTSSVCSSLAPKNAAEVIEYFLCLLQNFLIPLLIAVAFLMFIVGIVKYVTAGGNEERSSAAKGFIFFGLIALFVMTTVWGFVRILHNSFFNGDIKNPTLPGTGGEMFR